MTHHEAELLCKKKVTRKLFEELFTAPPLPSSGRPVPVRLKPSRCVLGASLSVHWVALEGGGEVLAGYGSWGLGGLPASSCRKDPCPTTPQGDLG